jgi:hypothetical protein
MLCDLHALRIGLICGLLAVAAAVCIPGAARADERATADDDSALIAELESVEEDFDDAPPTPTDAEAAAVGDDELWFVSTRKARYDAAGTAGLQFSKYDGAGGWRRATLDEFIAADASVPTCFHVHGNRVNYAQSNCGGWRFYNVLTDCQSRGPLRFVIVSWPSDRIGGGQRNDVRTKAVVAECHAYHLAGLVDRMPAEAQVSMVGYSYGARLIGGSLHLLGGGTLRGRRLTDRPHDQPRQVRAVLLAGALDSTHFLPGAAFQKAPTQIDHLLVARNPADRVLKWYPLLYKFTLRPKRGTQSMGYVGVAGHNRPELMGRVEYVNVACQVGNNHEWHGFEYLGGKLLTKMRASISFAPLGEE